MFIKTDLGSCCGRGQWSARARARQVKHIRMCLGSDVCMGPDGRAFVFVGDDR